MDLRIYVHKRKATGNWRLVPKLREQIVPGIRKQVQTVDWQQASRKKPAANRIS